MLEGLFNQLAAKSPPPIIAVPPVPSPKNVREPLQATAFKAVPLVPPVPSEKTETKTKNEKVALSACDRQKLLAYLDAIGETDQDIINEYLTERGKDTETLARELQQADDCLQIHAGDFTGMVQCSGCRHLSGNTCQLNGWRVVVDKWRRCNDVELQQKTTFAELVTCKACIHFESHYKHGGGAGACRAGVMPFGACWWADTLHDCNQFVKLSG